jgi:hypothetical protein
MEYYKITFPKPEEKYWYAIVDEGTVHVYDKNMKCVRSFPWFYFRNDLTRFTLITKDPELSKLMLLQK